MTDEKVLIGTVEVDLRAGVVQRDGAVIAMRAKSFALLSLLIGKAGAVVTRDEIVDAIWDGRAITDDAINQTIRDIRRSIGDDDARALQTVPKRGYRLAPPAPVPERPAATAAGEPPRHAAAARRRKPSIAVARFVNLGGGEDIDTLVRGHVDDLLAHLARLPTFRVVADPDGAGRAEADYLLAGSVRAAQGRLRITCRLTDTALGAAIWGDQFDGPAGDALDLMDRMSKAVIAAIESSTRLSEIEKATEKSLGEADAYDLLMRAIPISARNAVASSREAVDLLERSLALDGDSAAAHAYKAWAHQQLYFRGGFHAADRDAGLFHAEAAVRLGPNDPQALAIGGFVQGFLRDDFSAAIALLDRALSLNPNSPLALRFSALMNAFSYRVERARKDAMTALELAPLDPMNYHIYVATSFCGLVERRWDQVVDEAAIGIAINPDFPVLHAFLAAGLQELGRTAEARQAIDRLGAVAPRLTVSSVMRMGFVRPLEDRLAPALRAAGMAD